MFRPANCSRLYCYNFICHRINYLTVSSYLTVTFTGGRGPQTVLILAICFAVFSFLMLSLNVFTCIMCMLLYTLVFMGACRLTGGGLCQCYIILGRKGLLYCYIMLYWEGWSKIVIFYSSCATFLT